VPQGEDRIQERTAKDHQHEADHLRGEALEGAMPPRNSVRRRRPHGYHACLPPRPGAGALA
jgi:hypothetical protein